MTPGSGGALNYGFDASGNLTTLPTGATGSYDNASELTSSVLSGTTTTDYTYDSDGERTQAAISGTTSASASYNGAQELTAYDNVGVANMTAASYDGDGLRQTATTAGTTQSFTWDPSGSLPHLLMDSTNAYIYGPGNTPIEQVNLTSGTDQLPRQRPARLRPRHRQQHPAALNATTSYDAWGNPETTGGLTSLHPLRIRRRLHRPHRPHLQHRALLRPPNRPVSHHRSTRRPNRPKVRLRRLAIPSISGTRLA